MDIDIDTLLMQDIQRFLTEHRESADANTTVHLDFRTGTSHGHNEKEFGLQLDYANTAPPSRRPSQTLFQSHIYDLMSETTSNTGTEASAENLWKSFKQQILDLQAENNNILSLVADSEARLKNAAANVVGMEEPECEQETQTAEDYFPQDERKSNQSPLDIHLSCYDDVILPSPTEVALRTLLNTCKEREHCRNVLDDTLSLLNRGYDDKGFRGDIGRILGSGGKEMETRESIIDIIIRWIRFLVILFLSIIICILDGPSGLSEQR